MPPSEPAGPRQPDPLEPAHGHALDAADHRLLRGRPPAAALRWCATAAGRERAAVTHVEALAGGTSSAVHAVQVRDGRDRVHALVLRRFVRADWLAEEPDLARHEAAALELAGRSGLPVPRLVAVDADGAEAGAPAVLMTRLDGAVEWRPREPEPFLRALAEVLPRVHAVAVTGPASAAIPDYTPYGLRLTGPPSWTRRPEVWERALAAFAGLASAPPVAARLHPPRLPPGQRPVDGRRRERRGRLGEREPRLTRRGRRPLPDEPGGRARARRRRAVPRAAEVGQRARRVPPRAGTSPRRSAASRTGTSRAGRAPTRTSWPGPSRGCERRRGLPGPGRRAVVSVAASRRRPSGAQCMCPQAPPQHPPALRGGDIRE